MDIQTLLVVFGSVVFFVLSVSSAVAHDRQKRLWRAGKTDYYGNPL